MGVDGTEAEFIKALEETQKEAVWKNFPLSGPSFDMAQTKNITVQLDRMAVLGCRIKFLLSNSTVSAGGRVWGRSRKN